MIRRDLLAEYAEGRKLIQVAWGERQVDFDWPSMPEWFDDIRQEYANLWRQIELLDFDTRGDMAIASASTQAIALATKASSRSRGFKYRGTQRRGTGTAAILCGSGQPCDRRREREHDDRARTPLGPA